MFIFFALKIELIERSFHPAEDEELLQTVHCILPGFFSDTDVKVGKLRAGILFYFICEYSQTY